MIPRIAFAFLFALVLKPAVAEHLPGGSITYTCLGGNYFEVKLSLMRECSGFPMIAQSLHFTNSCGVVFDVSNIAPVQVPLPSQLCASDSLNTTCSGGAIAGFELYEFATEIYLSPCNYWTISWSICCRQPSVNIQSTPGLYLETRIDNETDPCNNSPVFNHNGVPRVCIGQPVNFDAGATDPDGSRMEYSLIDARFASPSPVSVNYVFPNYGGEPVAGMALDVYGQITFTPTQQGYIVVAVQVDEYDTNDVWIGSVMCDFPFLVTTCSNPAPDAAAGTIVSSSGSTTITGDRSFAMCNASDGCVTIEFTDPDQGQTLSIWNNIDQILPGASIETTGTDPLSVVICWTDLDLPAGDRVFVITVEDDACPANGARSFVYTATVNDVPSAGIDNAILVCPQAPTFALLDSLGGEPSSGGTWTTPDGNVHSGNFLASTDPAGVYGYEVGEGECITSAQLTISFLPETDSLCVLISVPEIGLHAVSVHPNPSTGQIVLESREPIDDGLTILDLQGRKVTTITGLQAGVRSEVIFPGNLVNGTYAVHGKFRSGGQFMFRVVLQR